MGDKTYMHERIMLAIMILFALCSNISTGVTSCCIVLSIIVAIAAYIQKREMPRTDKSILKVVVGYGICQCIIAALSLDPMHSAGDVWATMYRFIPLFMVLGYLRRLDQIEYILIAFSVSVLINDIAGAYQFILLDNNRPAGFNNTPTFFASHLLMAMPMLYLLTQKHNPTQLPKTLAGIILVFSFIMLLASGTRGGWVAFCIVLVSWFAMDKENRKKLLGICIALALGCGIINYTGNGFLSERVHSVGDMQYNTNVERFLMWESAVNIFKDYPVHGIGQDQFQYVYNTQYISPLAKERGDEDYHRGHGHPHNNFFKYLAEGGIVGIIAFFMLHGFFAYKMFKLYLQERKLPGISYGMIGLLIMIGIHVEGMTDTNLTQVPIMREYWFLMGLMFVAGQIRLEDSSKNL